MRSRPDVDIQVPKSIVPGETLHVRLTVTGRSKTPVRFIAVNFHVTEGKRPLIEEVGFEQREVLHETVTVAEDIELDAEVYHYEASFEVPSDLPPTYLGTLFEHRAWVEIQIVIPWWLDVRESYDVAIVAAPIPRAKAVPFAGESERGAGAFVEVSLRAQSFAPGETIEGALAFGNLGGADVTDIELALVAVERLAGRPEVSSNRSHSAFLAARSDGEGRQIPFGVVVPASTTTSLTLSSGTLSWFFEVSLHLDRGSDVTYRVPVEIASFEGRAPAVFARAPAAKVEAAPIGVERWRAAWAEAGEAVGLALDFTKLRLTGELSGCDVSVRAGKSEGKGSSLTARLRFRSWGLGLSIVNPKSLDLGPFFPAEKLDRRPRATGRDPEQARASFSPSLRDALLPFDDFKVGDDQADVRLDVPGYDQPSIGDFLDCVTALARALAEAARDVPPPAAMADHLGAWRRFAADLDADLTAGNMEISGGEFEGAIAEIRTVFAGKAPSATRVALVIDPPLDAPVDLASAGAVERLPPSARELLRSIEALCRPLVGFDDLGEALRRPPPLPAPVLREAMISLEIPAVLPDPAALREVLSALLALAAAARGDRRAGPYR